MNKRLTTIARVAAGTLTLSMAAAAAAAPITVTLFETSTRAGSAFGVVVDEDQQSSTAFGVRSVGSSVAGSSSELRVDAQDSGTGALFDFDFGQVLAGDHTYADTKIDLRFTVGSGNISYAFSGLYAMDGQRATTLDVSLWHTESQSSNGFPFRDRSQSQQTANESFTLGDVGDGDSGPYQNWTMGALNGTLLAGHTYWLFIRAAIDSTATSSAGAATASGCVSLALGDAQLDTQCGIPAENAAAAAAAATQTVPEPGSLALAGLALAGLASARRRPRSARAAG